MRCLLGFWEILTDITSTPSFAASFLFYSTPLPISLQKFPSLWTPMPLWLCIFSCSSAGDHFDVYFTAAAKRRRVVSHTPR